jgi:hypothetical protein
MSGGGSFGLLLALAGGIAIGGFAVGSCALGVVALGAVAAGWYAMGSAAFGKYVCSFQGSDPQAVEFFRHLLGSWVDQYFRLRR